MGSASLIALLLAPGVAGRCATQEKPPPITAPDPIEPPEPIPPPDAIAPPSPDGSRTGGSRKIPAEPTIQRCQRCGYVVDSGWRFCPACGWDHFALAGDAAGNRLEQIQRSVVGVVVIKEKPGFEDFLSPEQLDELRRYLWIYGNGGQKKHFGSALPYGEEGLYVTRSHILQRGQSVQLRNYRNHFVKAAILGYDVPSGIGVVKADPAGIPPLPMAAGELRAEERSWVVCYPVLSDDEIVHYLPATIHSGRLIDRGYFGTQIVSFENFMRTDHTLPAGCQGGLLVDSLGMAAGIVLDSPDDGITYAQPLRDMIPIIEKLARGEPIVRPYYGLGLAMPDERLRVRFGLPHDARSPLVAFLIDGSPAFIAGVEGGDVLTAIDGEPVADVIAAGTTLLARAPGGDPVRFTVARGAERLDLMVRPDRRAERVMLDPADEMQEALQANLIEVKSGKSSLHGLRVAQLVRGGRGEKEGYREGDIIRKVARAPVRDLETLNRVVREENPDMFGHDAEGPERGARMTYFVELEVRTAEGKVEDRYYVNLFPENLAPPVY